MIHELRNVEELAGPRRAAVEQRIDDAIARFRVTLAGAPVPRAERCSHVFLVNESGSIHARHSFAWLRAVGLDVGPRAELPADAVVVIALVRDGGVAWAGVAFVELEPPPFDVVAGGAA